MKTKENERRKSALTIKQTKLLSSSSSSSSALLTDRAVNEREKVRFDDRSLSLCDSKQWIIGVLHVNEEN